VNYMERRKQRGVAPGGLPVQDLTPVAQPPAEPVHREDHRPDLCVARVRAQGLRIEQHAEIRLAAGELVTRAEQEYRGAVVQTGPTPEHLEPLESYVARVASDPAPKPDTPRAGHVPDDLGCEMCGTCYGCDGCADPDHPLDLARGDCEGCGTCGPCIAACRALREPAEDGRPDNWPIGEAWPETPDPSGPLVDAEPLADLPEPIPPGTPAPPGPKPRQLPCEVCGVGVLTSYVEQTGRQRHGHHPEGS